MLALGRELELLQPNKINSYSENTMQPELQQSENVNVNADDCWCYILDGNAVKDRIRQCLGIAKRNTLNLCLALMAMDGLDLCLQQQGYQKTDQVLIDIIQEIQDHLRECDWVAYWEKNQFLMVIFSDAEGAKIALERIVKAFQNREIYFDNAVITYNGKIGFTQVHHNEHMNACLERMETAVDNSQRENKSLFFLS